MELDGAVLGVLEGDQKASAFTRFAEQLGIDVELVPLGSYSSVLTAVNTGRVEGGTCSSGKTRLVESDAFGHGPRAQHTARRRPNCRELFDLGATEYPEAKEPFRRFHRGSDRFVRGIVGNRGAQR